MAKKKTTTTTTTSAPKKSLAAARGVVGKVLKDDDPSVTVETNSLRMSRPHFTTGSVVLDYLIGGSPNRFGVPPCPGWPRGMISNIYGHESSGKTTIALEAAAAVCDLGGTVCFIDWEHAISLDYAAALGVPVDDPDRFYLVAPNTLEAGVKVLFACARAGVDLIILDSVGAAVPEDITNQSVDEKGSIGRVGLLASKWSAVLRELAGDISKSGSHVMGISQMRSTINTGGYGNGPSTSPQGGNAWKFFSALRLKFQKVSSVKTKDYDAMQHKMNERVTSIVVRATVDKSKVSNSQQRQMEFHITFGEGIDNVKDMMAVAINHGIINKGGAWYSYERADGTTIKAQGQDNFKNDLLNTQGAFEELATFVMKAIMDGSTDAAKNRIYDGDPILESDDEVPEDLGEITD